MNEINKNIRKVDTKLSISEVNKIAKETAKALGSDFRVTKDSVDTASFDLDYMGEEYDGGSYLIMDNGDVVNFALPKSEVYYNYKTKKKYEFGGDFQAGVYAGGGGVKGKDTWQNIFEEYGFKKGRSKYGLEIYYKKGYTASVDKNLRNVEFMFEDDVLYKGYSIQGLLNALENEFGKRNFEDGGSLGSQYVLIKSIGNYGMGKVSFLVSKKELNKIPFDTIQEKAEAFVNNKEDSFGETSYRFDKLITNPKEISDYAKGYNHSNYKVVLSNDEENYPDGFYIIKSKNYLKFKEGGGVGLIGNQKRIDMNKNGKIDAEDFKILRSSMNGAWRKEHKYANHSEDYEVRYAKPRPKRTGYKGKRKFDDGGGIGMKYYVISNKQGKVVSKGFDTDEQAKEQMYKLFEKTKDFSYSTKKMAKGGGVGLIGNQKRIDMNKNGKIDAEDFKILRSSMNGAWRKEHKYANHSEDYEVRYAKPRPKRTGYKGKRNFKDGGGLSFGGKNPKIEKYSVYIEYGNDNDNEMKVVELDFTSFKEAYKVYKQYSKSDKYKGEDIIDMMILKYYLNGDFEQVDDVYLNGGGIDSDKSKSENSFTNKDGIRVRSKVEPKEKISEKEWMAKHNSSKEARSYMAGGSIRDIKWANADNKKLGVWLLTSVDGNAILNKSKNATELEKNVMDYYKKRGSVARMTWDDDADDGLSWVTFTDLYNEIKSYYMAGGKTETSTKKGKGNHKMKAVTDYAKKIRKDGEKWTDALRRAYQEMK